MTDIKVRDAVKVETTLITAVALKLNKEVRDIVDLAYIHNITLSFYAQNLQALRIKETDIADGFPICDDDANGWFSNRDHYVHPQNYYLEPDISRTQLIDLENLVLKDLVANATACTAVFLIDGAWYIDMSRGIYINRDNLCVRKNEVTRLNNICAGVSENIQERNARIHSDAILAYIKYCEKHEKAPGKERLAKLLHSAGNFLCSKETIERNISYKDVEKESK